METYQGSRVRAVAGCAVLDGTSDPALIAKHGNPARSLQRSFTRAAVIFLSLICVYFGTVGVASAQSNDWIANVNDVGFDPTIAGATITYQVAVDNSSLTASPATTISLSIPAGTVFTGATGTITGCAPTPATGPATVVCTVPAMVADGRVTAAVNLRTTASGTYTLNVSVPTANDPDTANNTAGQSTTVVAGANMQLQLAGPATAPAGGTINYTFTATNLGPNAATNETVTFSIPAGLVDVVPPAGCTLSGSSYVCLIPGPIAVGAAVTLPFSAQVSAANGSTITAIGSVAGTTPPDGDTSNNTATLNTAISPGSDLTIAKARAPGGTLLVGDTVTFTLSPTYTGDSPSSLVVTDVLPPNYTFVSVAPAGGSGWSCGRSGQTVTCTKASGSVAGADVPLGTIVITATAASVGNPVNTASIRSTSPGDPDLSNNSATDGGASIVAPFGDLAAAKSGPAPALVVVGNSYDFGLSATNLGNAPFFGTVVLTDAVPAGLTITNYALNGFTCLPATNVVGPANVVCSIVYTAASPLLPGQSTPTITTTALVTAPNSLQNTVTVSSPDGNLPDTVSGNDTATYSVGSSPGGQSADISVNKTRTLASLSAGDVETFAIEIVNAGPVASSNVSVSDTLAQLMNANVGPTGQGFIASSIVANSATGVTCSTAPSGGTARQLSCTIAALPICTAGSTCPVITVQVRPGGNAGPRTNSAFAISSVTADPALGNNTGTATYAIVARTDVTVAKTGSPNPASAGQDLTYVITASTVANGLSDAANVTITDTLPSDVVFVSATPSTGSCSAAPATGSTTAAGNNQIVCNLGTVANGAQQTVQVVVRPLTVTRLTTITNSVAVTTSTPETDTTNNAASVAIPVQNPGFDLLVNKTENTDPVAVGDNTTYTISVINLGPSAIENVVMTDTLPGASPGQISFVSFTVPTGGTCGTVPAVGQVGGTFQCSFARLPANATRDITITMRGVVKGTVTNNVVVRSDESVLGFDSNTANNTDGESTTIRTRADMQVVSKIASPNPIDLREPFVYTILVRNNTGGILAEADNTVLSDTLPAGMQLAGTPTATVVSGTISINTCTGVSGSVSFSCNFGTFSSGGQVSVNVPVRVTDETTQSQSFRNTATIATSSLDVQPNNDSNFGDVVVNSSSISGVVYYDFNDNGSQGPQDNGLGLVPMTLSGTAFDGTIVNASATSDPTTGAFTFGFLPRGTYTITRGAPGVPYVNDGTDTAGTAGGALAPPTQITTIALPTNNAATGYLFAVVPQARVGIAKFIPSGPDVNADGSFDVTFQLQATNFSLETLSTITITDPLTGSAPGFGSFVTLPNPATSPMVNGTYTMIAAPSGSCGTPVAAFDGATNVTLATGAGPIPGGTCLMRFTIRVKPTVPLPAVLPSGGRYDNQAVVTGVGLLSGQSEANNPQLRDLSNNGTNTDANGNGQANEAGENNPTPITPSINPSVALVKTATTNFATPPVVGNTISYTFAVTNTGNVNLSGVTLTDVLPGLVLTGGPIALLAPNATDSTTITGLYTLTQADVDAGRVVNQATVSGTDPYNTVVTDQSGSSTTNNTATTTPITAAPSIALLKVANASGVANPAQVGNVITYAFTVRNTGNVTLTNVGITDPKLGLTLIGGPIATLAPGAQDSVTFTASYPITQVDIDAAGVTNTATATGTTPTGGTVTDPSGTTLTNNAPTVVPLATVAAITLVKTATEVFSEPPTVGDKITYAFRIQNTGNLTLTNVGLTDVLPGIVISGGPISTLAPNAVDTTTFTAEYTLTQADIDAGQVVNSATTLGFAPNGAGVSDVSGSAANNNTPTTTPIAQTPAITLVKLQDTSGLSNPAVAGNVIVYDFIATNTGNVTLTNVQVTDQLAGAVMTGGPIATFAPGDTDSITFRATYTLTQADVDRGQVTNTALVTGTPPLGADVTDIAGTAADNDLPVITPLGESPAIRLQKTANLSALSTPPRVGDLVSYTFTVRNAGNVTLSGITLADTLPGIVVSGGPIASLAPGGIDTATFTASYALTQANIDAGGVQNQATATGAAPGGALVSDLSGTDLVNDTPTNAPIIRAPAITLIKSATPVFSSPVRAGDLINYAFTVRNAGNVTLTSVSVRDLLPGLTVSGGPLGSLAVGAVDTTTFTGRYALTQADIDLGRVVNTATTAGTSPSGVVVNDTSGSTAANDTPTTVLVVQSPAITLDKAYTTSGNPLGAVAGDVFTYTFTITNTGNTTLTNVTLSDPLPNLGLAGGPIPSLAPGAVDSITYVGTYTVSVADLGVGFVNNTASVVGNYTNGSGAAQTVQARDSVSAVVMTVDAISEVFPPIATNGGSTTIMLTSDLAAGQPATLIPGRINSVILTVIATSNPGITLNTATGIITLAPNLPAGNYTVTYQICSALVPSVCDTATETVNQLPRPAIKTTKTQVLTDNGDGITGVGDTVTYTITVANTGNTPISNLTLADRMTTAVSGAALTLDSGPTFVSASAGSTNGTLQLGETASYTARFTLTIAAVSGGGVSNSVTATGLPVYGPDVVGTPSPVSDVSDNGIDGDGNAVDDPTVLLVAPIITTSGLTLTKTTPLSRVLRGSVVPYTITVRNANVSVVGVVNIVDTLPANFVYVAGTATLNGVAVTPVVAGRKVTFTGVPVPPLSTITLTVNARILTGAAAGAHRNVVDIFDPATGVQLAPQAAATVRIEPEPVFDCSDVIGKVFDDVNRNGYQDGPNSQPPALLTKDDVYQGKYGDPAPAIKPTADIPEPGIPGVRVVGVDGTIITTDAFGRFHVPCAALPSTSGSNFILKVDARTLPSGYRLTTENPRVMRLTRGKMSEMNFGAAITRIARVDLNARAFVVDGGQLKLVAPLAAGMDQLLARIIDTPTNIRLAFYLPQSASAAEKAQARRDMTAVERYIRQRWAKIEGRYKLTIEKTIVRKQ